MKIQCNVCEVAEAKVLCCADEATLCQSCDEKVHASNKLASKHPRVPLSTSSSHQMPKCDICQETVGYFFCLEDRALLCRKCDVAIHTVNANVSAHQRFVLTGVKLGLGLDEPSATSSLGLSNFGMKVTESESCFQSKRGAPLPSSSQYIKATTVQTSAAGSYTQSELPLVESSPARSVSHRQFDEFLGLNEFNQCFGLVDNGPSEADSLKLGDSDSSLYLRGDEEELDAEECLGQVPQTS